MHIHNQLVRRSPFILAISLQMSTRIINNCRRMHAGTCAGRVRTFIWRRPDGMARPPIQ